MAGISEKEVGGVLTVALAANLALNGHLIAKLVHVGARAFHILTEAYPAFAK
jgi:hypothetical protein